MSSVTQNLVEIYEKLPEAKRIEVVDFLRDFSWQGAKKRHQAKRPTAGWSGQAGLQSRVLRRSS